MLRGIAFCAALFISHLAVSQTAHRQNRNIFPEFGNYANRGWLFAGGFTYMLPWPAQKQVILEQTPELSTKINYTAKGRLGINAEVGRFNVFSSAGLVKYIDYSVGFNYLRGVETFEAVSISQSGTQRLSSGKGVFNQGYLTLNFNLNNYTQFGDFWFIKNSLGINGDYRILSSFAYDHRKVPVNTSLPVEVQAQIHYKFGIGYKISKNILLIPSIETPILTVYHYDELKSSFPAFSSEYRPIIMRLEVLLLDHRAGRKCPTGSKKSSKSSLFGKGVL